jgi:hypothetical protein
LGRDRWVVQLATKTTEASAGSSSSFVAGDAGKSLFEQEATKITEGFALFVFCVQPIDC